MGKNEDPGFCLLGASMLLEHAAELEGLAKDIRKMDADAVHDMRVASRRLRAGLPIFSSCFKDSQYGRWKKCVKGITGALGEARDLDVQAGYLQELMERSGDASREGLEVILESKKARRKDLQPQLVGWLDDLKEDGSLDEMVAFLEKAVEKLSSGHADVRSKASFAVGLANVSSRTEALLELEDCVGDPDAKERHHAMRIAAKRLRYTIEAFKPLFDDELEEEIGVMKRVQDTLGEMHDCDVWLSGLDALEEEVRAPREKAQAVERGLEAIRKDREEERNKLYGELVPLWGGLRSRRFFEQAVERFRSGLASKDLSIPLADVHGPARLGVISDVHGNLDALRAVLDDARKNGVAGFLNLGDMVGYGAYPEEVVRELSGDLFLSVAGNFDLKVLDAARSSQRPKAGSAKETVVSMAAGELSEDSLKFIGSLPPELRLEVLGKRLLLVHASPADPDEHIGPETGEARLAELARTADADIVMVGHSHKPLVRKVKGVLFLNPGSVGRPGDHDPRASYAILDTGDFSVRQRRVGYDVEAAVRAMSEKGLPPELGEALRRGLTSSEALGERGKPPKKGQGGLEAARKLDPDRPHSEQVARLARTLFRELGPLHGLGKREEDLLEAACLLHDIGLSEGGKGHHKASCRLIMEQKLPFGSEDRRTVALVARYHRKRMPGGDEPDLAELDEEARSIVLKLASILRIADGLDRTHGGVVKEVKCHIAGDRVALTVVSDADAAPEIEWGLRKGDLFERTFDKRLSIS